MWPLVAWLLLYPIALRLSEWLVAHAGRQPGSGDARLDAAFYLIVSVVLLAVELATLFHPAA